MHEDELEIFDEKAQEAAFDKIVADFEYEDEMGVYPEPEANAQPNAYDIAQE